MTSTPRRVVANFVLSLDGRINGPEGEFDMGWVVPHATSPTANAHFERVRAATGTVLLGRKNHDGYLGYWPAIADDPEASEGDRAISRWLTDIDKIVFSNSIDASPWTNTTVTDRAPADLVRELRSSAGDDIVVLPSMSIIHQLLAADLIDRLSITLAPEIAGGGERLFEDLDPTSWETIDAALTETGAVCMLIDRRR